MPPATPPLGSVVREAPQGLDRAPGPHFEDDVVDEERDRWAAERYDPSTSPARQQHVLDLLHGVGMVTPAVECRESLCRISLDTTDLAYPAGVLARLGADMAILKNDGARVVVLLPGLQIDELPPG